MQMCKIKMWCDAPSAAVVDTRIPDWIIPDRIMSWHTNNINSSSNSNSNMMLQARTCESYACCPLRVTHTHLPSASIFAVAQSSRSRSRVVCELTRVSSVHSALRGSASWTRTATGAASGERGRLWVIARSLTVRSPPHATVACRACANAFLYNDSLHSTVQLVYE